MVAFNEIANNNRTPFTFIEFNNANAIQGANALAFKLLIIGQMLATGTATPKVPVVVTSEQGAMDLFGRSSMLHHMVKKALLNNSSTELIVFPLEDDGDGDKAAGSITFTGTATKSGLLTYYIAGHKVRFAVEKDDNATAVGDSLVSAITDDKDLPFTAANNAGAVTLTFKHAGEVGNKLDIRLGYYQDEKAKVEGITSVIVAFTGGTANPDLATELATLPEEMYNVVVCPYVDTANLAALKDEFDSRWNAAKQLDGMVATAETGTHSALGTFGDSLNDPHLQVMECHKSPSPVYEWAAGYGAVLAFEMQKDPARPMQTVAIKGVLAEEKQDEFTREERNLLLFDGISTHYVDAAGGVRIERSITTYKLNAQGAVDVSYLDSNTLFTLSYIRYDLRTFILNKYPRHKLANDGVLIRPGNPVMTPSVAKSEAIGRAKIWETLGYVENIDAFKEGLIVERNGEDANRLDWVLTPDLMNQLRVNAIQIAFLL